jgi:hypothetical protein
MKESQPCLISNYELYRYAKAEYVTQMGQKSEYTNRTNSKQQSKNTLHGELISLDMQLREQSIRSCFQLFTKGVAQLIIWTNNQINGK